jgi:hypothetical protein
MFHETSPSHPISHILADQLQETEIDGGAVGVGDRRTKSDG